MAGEQVEREFETQSARLTETETNLAETEAALAELGEENAKLQERLLQSEEQQMALENDHRSTVEAMQQQMESQAKALEHLRTEDGRADSAEGSLKQLEALNDELLAALVEVRAENEALSHDEIVKQMDEVQRMNQQLNEALEAKNAQVRHSLWSQSRGRKFSVHTYEPADSGLPRPFMPLSFSLAWHSCVL
jgi:SMC interacting uncharacterized protein involved in chromosome segregation